MNTLHATSKTSMRFHGAVTPATPHREHMGKGEIVGWVVMAAIWGLSAVAFYILWIKASGRL